MGKIDKNKQQKRTSLLETAFGLFTSRGIHNTSISNIVESAGVAKGTFYLYFKDKYAVYLEKVGLGNVQKCIYGRRRRLL